MYDGLHSLVEEGLLRQWQTTGGNAIYELERNDNHHHVICRHCRCIFDVACIQGFAPCLDLAQTHGFVVDEAELIYWGLCPECQKLSLKRGVKMSEGKCPFGHGTTHPTQGDQNQRW